MPRLARSALPSPPWLRRTPDSGARARHSPGAPERLSLQVSWPQQWASPAGIEIPSGPSFMHSRAAWRRKRRVPCKTSGAAAWLCGLAVGRRLALEVGRVGSLCPLLPQGKRRHRRLSQLLSSPSRRNDGRLALRGQPHGRGPRSDDCWSGLRASPRRAVQGHRSLQELQRPPWQQLLALRCHRAYPTLPVRHCRGLRPARRQRRRAPSSRTHGRAMRRVCR